MEHRSHIIGETHRIQIIHASQNKYFLYLCSKSLSRPARSIIMQSFLLHMKLLKQHLLGPLKYAVDRRRGMVPIVVRHDHGELASEGVNPGTIEGRRSTSLTGLILNPSAVSIDGTAVARGWILWREGGKKCCLASCPL